MERGAGHSACLEPHSGTCLPRASKAVGENRLGSSGEVDPSLLSRHTAGARTWLCLGATCSDLSKTLQDLLQDLSLQAQREHEPG